jgi:hypothetical protein
MTPKEEFHNFIGDPKTGELLKAMAADNQRIDRELAAIEDRRLCEQNEATYLRAVALWFEKTEPSR